MTPLKQKLQKRELSLGSWLTFPCEASTEILAKAGFEWLVLDMEHAPIGISEAARLIRIIELSGIAALCRLPSNDPVLAKNVLDAGATGIIIPMIESAEEARKAVESAYYPPQGRRGVGLARAQNYGSGFESYSAQMNDRLVVIGMIETRAGVDNIEAIAATKELDGVLMGPYDLSGSLGCIGQLDHPDLATASTKVREAVRKRNLGYGLHLVHPSHEGIKKAIESGYTFLALGVDMILLNESAKSTLSDARNAASAFSS